MYGMMDSTSLPTGLSMTDVVPPPLSPVSLPEPPPPPPPQLFAVMAIKTAKTIMMSFGLFMIGLPELPVRLAVRND
jgi:hypothetical protein